MELIAGILLNVVYFLKHPVFRYRTIGYKTFRCVLDKICVNEIHEINLMSGIVNYYEPLLCVTSSPF